MKHAAFYLITAMSLGLVACQATVKTPPVEVQLPGGTEVTIDPDSDNDAKSGSGKFCPPGQRKKGNC